MLFIKVKNMFLFFYSQVNVFNIYGTFGSRTVDFWQSSAKQLTRKRPKEKYVNKILKRTRQRPQVRSCPGTGARGGHYALHGCHGVVCLHD